MPRTRNTCMAPGTSGPHATANHRTIHLDVGRGACRQRERGKLLRPCTPRQHDRSTVEPSRAADKTQEPDVLTGRCVESVGVVGAGAAV
eukprot:2607679-Rhodomonas_salina.1